MSISMSEVKKHKNTKSAWIVIHNDVYDVSKFLDEHPGGADTLLEVAGKDGTQDFEDVGHSDDAREMMKKYKIGSLPAEESAGHIEPCWWWLWVVLAVGVAAGGAFAYKKYG